ncbi:MAG: trimethylamine methyltransferase family protein [Anaerolineales bacterium]|jgi:trimethylamine--corrinoid protein Co-methyltransferase
MIQTHGQSKTSAQFSRLGKQECEQIHVASLEVLERVGIETRSTEACEVLASAGASVDGQLVRIPEHMVTQALATAPKRMTLFDRDGQAAIKAWGYNSYFGGGSDCLNVLDHHSGERRRAVLKDVIDASRLMDALPEIDFVMSAFLPSDVPDSVYPHYQMEAMINNTTKPIVFVTPDFGSCVDCVEMAEIAAGGETAFRERPFAVCYINVTSGMVANEDSLQKCIYFAQKGLPQLYIPLNAAGVNSPATTAGCMATMNAGTLLGVVLSQLVRPGTPIAVPGWNGGPYNLQTMVGNYCLPDEQGVAIAMGKYYDLPVFGLGGSTDSKVLDQQAGAECALGLLFPLLNGANIVHDIGFMDAGMQGSLQLMAIADDLLGWLRAATRGVIVNEETLAMDVVEELGPDGDYLSHDHTFRHFKDAYYSKLADRQIFSAWQDSGGLSMGERASKKVDAILAEHEPEPLSPDIKTGLKDFVKRAEEAAA